MPDNLADLGRRERQIMDILYRRGSASAAEVLADLPDPPSYSAVRGMLRLLEEKGHVRHEWSGPRHVYRPAADVEQVRLSAARHLLRTFFDNSMESAVAAMLGVAEQPPSPEGLQRLARLIEEAGAQPNGNPLARKEETANRARSRGQGGRR
jgi:BlaI family transcriptional regulator, penicillinase repressor